MARVTLRDARRDDVPRLAEIWHSGWRDAHLDIAPRELVDERTEESFVARTADRVPHTAVAVVEGEIAGFAVVIDDELEQLYVSAGHRGRGVAGVLIGEAERRIGSAGYEKAWLAVAPGNPRAIAFYEKSGWHDEGLFDYAAESSGGTIAVPCLRYVKRVA
jgi:ribosomal protein S18 acetylase RimI-like enzyme